MLISNINLFNKLQSANKGANRYLHSLLLRVIDEGRETAMRLSSTTLQRELGRKYLNIIKEAGFVRCDRFGVGKCYSYRFLGQISEVSTKADRTVWNNRKCFDMAPGYKNVLNNMSEEKYLHNTAALNRCAKAQNLNELTISTDDLRGGRVTTAISQISAELRPYIRLNGEKMIEVDTKSSQPRYSLGVMGITPDKFDSPEELAYINAVYEGKVYLHIAEQTGLCLPVVKKCFSAAWNDDLNERSNWNNRGKKSIVLFFKNKLPRIYKAVKDFAKANGKKMIGNTAMAAEATTINATVEKLKAMGFIAIPIYDSIMTDASEPVCTNLLVAELKKAWNWAKDFMNETLVKATKLKEKASDDWNMWKAAGLNSRVAVPAKCLEVLAQPTTTQPTAIHFGSSVGRVLPNIADIKSGVVRSRLFGEEAAFWRELYGYRTS